MNAISIGFYLNTSNVVLMGTKWRIYICNSESILKQDAR